MSYKSDSFFPLCGFYLVSPAIGLGPREMLDVTQKVRETPWLQTCQNKKRWQYFFSSKIRLYDFFFFLQYSPFCPLSHIPSPQPPASHNHHNYKHHHNHKHHTILQINPSTMWLLKRFCPATCCLATQWRLGLLSTGQQSSVTVHWWETITCRALAPYPSTCS